VSGWGVGAEMAYCILGFSFSEGVTVFIWLERTTLLAVKFRSYAGAGVYIANTLFLPQFCIIGGRRASIMRLFERQQVQRLGCRSDVMPWRIFLAVDARWLFN
jgi:hypothetical protein